MKLRSMLLGKVLMKFLWVDIGLTALLMINIIIARFGESGGTFLTYDLTVSLLISLNVVIYHVIYLFWLFKVHIDLQELDDTYPITPGGALARVLIPIYNLYGLWNVYSTMANHLKKISYLNELGMKLAIYIPFYYTLHLVMRGVNSFILRKSAEESFSNLWFISYIGDVALVVMYILIIKAVSTGLFGLSEHFDSNYDDET
ncbi:hypothetical protein [Halobacillus litoralis]|uniref:DUF4328 domain-containing protein n=1 Tax=Halobacillus litoralis TaxID=45668 RepID=A0A410M9X8_9BACI|nr:hypothetical protein [Halobacillus litoralis]QAS51525.1 hypothetical protein HLI_04455 [Halobacillus litoralis]